MFRTMKWRLLNVWVFTTPMPSDYMSVSTDGVNYENLCYNFIYYLNFSEDVGLFDLVIMELFCLIFNTFLGHFELANKTTFFCFCFFLLFLKKTVP